MQLLFVKKKRKKAKVWVMCPTAPASNGFDPFWALVQKLIKRKVQPSITLKEREKMAHPSGERQTVSDTGC